jgi:rhamnopyranosyl-N-acetylglucosaminyl-diphospho-decaprenol beta-1,3/1,4-galactofuranosyltransferase
VLAVWLGRDRFDMEPLNSDFARGHPPVSTKPDHARVHGVLVTFRRPEQLASSLSALAGQTRPLDELVVVDNSPDPENERAVRERVPAAEYVPASENLGPAGGIALGMRRVLEIADDRDWIMTLDDDDPPPDSEVFAMLADFAAESCGSDPATGGVGLSGTRFDRRSGRIVRVPNSELHGAVPVDCIAGNQCPLYSVAAVRAVGPLRPELFFGLEELEFGLRLRDAGYSLYGHGPSWYEGRAAGGRLGAHLAPARSLGEPTWRRYYSLRNLVWILRAIGRRRSAMRVAVLTGLGKPIANLPRRPRAAVRHLRLNWAACRDAWTGRMGRTVEPTM